MIFKWGCKLKSKAINISKRHISSTNKLCSDPLKIAYFGTDKFSISSLDRLKKFQEENPDRIESINVITRSIKPTGRNLKTLVDVPVGSYCSEHDMNIIRADSADEILNLVQKFDFNITVAVSFGKLIPADFINSCKYGGLNVHPSLLPKYSGSSPLQYAIMNDDKVTGVSIQTLHPTKFDKGDILLQSNEVEIEDREDFNSLQEKLGNIGADLLIDAINKELFLHKKPISNNYNYSIASKISPFQSEIRWNNMSTRAILRLNDALGPLHTYKYVDIFKKKRLVQEYQKVLLCDIKHENECSDGASYRFLNSPGEFQLNEDNSRLVIKTLDNFISVGSLKLQYCNEEDPFTFVKHLKKRVGSTKNIFTNIYPS